MTGVNSISSLLSDEFSWAMTLSICPSRICIFFIRRSRFRSTVFRQTKVYLLALDSIFCPVNVFHIQADEAFGREKEYGLGKHLVDFLLHPIAETVDGNEIRFLISGKPDIMDVTVKELFDFPAGVDVVHIGIQNDLEHHPGMVRAAPAFLIQLPETFKVQALNQSVNHPNWIMLCNILVNSWRKKHCLVGIVRTKMYLCHSIKCYA